jgi:hypothetical protein
MDIKASVFVFVLFALQSSVHAAAFCPRAKELFVFKQLTPDNKPKVSCNGALRKKLLKELRSNMDKACDHDFQDRQKEIKYDKRCKSIFKKFSPTENLEDTDRKGNIKYKFNGKPTNDDKAYWAKKCDEVRNGNKLLTKYFQNAKSKNDLLKKPDSVFRKKKNDWEAVVGFWEDIEKTRGGKGDLLNREKHKLETKKWTACFNMRWVICAAAGKLPRQQNAKRPGQIKLVTTQKQLQTMVSKGIERVTLFEYCTLKTVCPILNDPARLKKQKKELQIQKPPLGQRFVCDFNKKFLRKL